MNKIIVNGKEIEIGPDGRIPLSEEELESASGGLTLPRGMIFFQWRCREPGCGCVSEWYDEGGDCKSNLGIHNVETGHYMYEYYIRRLD